MSFNPRPRMGGDLVLDRYIGLLASFNPRPRMGGDFAIISLILHSIVFQSTPPHGGRHILPYGEYGNTVSIHAPAWGATMYKIRSIGGEKCFNPRPRMGGDER